MSSIKPSANIARPHSSRPDPSRPDPSDPGEPEPKGPNLILYYTLIALALATAIGLALMIVRPFYTTRH